MTEAILIEIAQRFRKLEDALEALHPDTELVVAEEFISEGDNHSPRSYLIECAEACRDDMVAMQERIRKCIEGRCEA
jgi:hypothetical protein